MIRHSLVAMALLAGLAAHTSGDVGQIDTRVVVEEVKPDRTQYLRPKDRAQVRSVLHKPKAVILKILGHPREVIRQRDGSEVWNYTLSWTIFGADTGVVSIRNGVCDKVYTIPVEF